MNLDFGVYGLLRSEDDERIVDSLDRHPAAGRVLYHEKIADELDRKGYPLKEMTSKDLDFIMTIGGDGTILRLLQKTDQRILGMNTGNVGFLTARDLSEVEKALNLIDRGDYFVDERIKLEVVVNGKKRGECTNEAVIHTNQVAKVRGFKIHQEDSEIDWFRGDGLIVSTPTGSTCYSMSAGGPIVNPEVEAFVIVAISPYELSTKPYVVPVDRDINVELTTENKTCRMVLDGQKELDIDSTDELTFRLSENRAKFISFESNFYQRIRKKLVWK